MKILSLFSYFNDFNLFNYTGLLSVFNFIIENIRNAGRSDDLRGMNFIII
jgi:hypothetical protein